MLPAALALAASATLLVACGSDEEPDATGDAPVEAPSAADFPEPTGTLDDLLADVGESNEIVASQAGGVFEPGDERFGFGLFDVGGAQITDARVAIYASPGVTDKAIGPFPARIESLATEPEFVAQTTLADDAKVVYVADVPFDEPGEWRLVAVVEQPDGLVATNLQASVIVDDYKRIPGEGEPAPEVHTPTLAEVGGDVEAIDTRVPPSTMHGDDLAEALGKKPVVLLFATPALCQSRVCGPVVDVAEQVKAEYGDEVAFIHQEIYVDNIPGPENLRPQVKAYGLFTEPWLFVIDGQGEVATRIEGAFSVSELESALEPSPAEPQATRHLARGRESPTAHHGDPSAACRARRARSPAEPPTTAERNLRRTAFWVAVTGISLYLVAPSLIEVLSSWDDLGDVEPWWFPVMVALQALGLLCLWYVQRVALHTVEWVPVIYSQLAGNALSKIAPAGGAVGGALQYRMLVEEGAPKGRVAAAITAVNLLTFAVVLVLPVLAIPAFLTGGVDRDLVTATLIGLGVLVLLAAAAIALLAFDEPLAWLGRTVQKIRNWIRRSAAPLRTLPDRLIDERDRLLEILGPRWGRAVAGTVARWAFDYATLLAALAAVGSTPRPILVLLAFCAAQVLAQIPLTPGGLGFVEAGLTATLALAGVPAAAAVLATLAYRLVSYWLPLPIGLVAYIAHRRRIAVASP